jgi:hypothetical protein
MPQESIRKGKGASENVKNLLGADLLNTQLGR